MTIGELNTRVVVQSIAVSQDDDGNIVATPSAEWEKWAKIEQDSGNLLISQGMSNFSESFRVTMRYEQSRPTRANYILSYDNKTMKVYNVRIEELGNRWFERITAYTSN